MIRFLSLLFIFAHVCVCFAKISVADLSDEEKVGQLLMVFFKGEEINEEAIKLISEAHVGGFIYYNWANGLKTPQQIQNLSNALQQLAHKQKHRIPLLIAVDQEGGKVTRLRENFTEFPGNEALAKLPLYYTMKSALYIGEELKAVGVNFNLAPVVDVNSNPAHTVLGSRSFGNSARRVAKHGQYALDGYRKAKVIAALKHFPGYGEASVDPHLGLPTVNKTRAQLEKEELYPFKCLHKQASAIMTAHIVMSALDPSNCTTLSHAIVEDLLRNTWGYQGVIISDSLVMEGLLQQCESVDEAAIRAFLAGHDILLFGGKMLSQKNNKDLTTADFLRIYASLLNAVKSGRISQTRLNASVERILNLKEEYDLFSQIYPRKQEISKFIKSQAHQQLAEKITSLTR